MKFDRYTIERLHLAQRLAAAWDNTPPHLKFILVAWLAIGAAYIVGRS